MNMSTLWVALASNGQKHGSVDMAWRWALYAERFMDELGAFDDPSYELGFSSGQALRAARIVVDIGMLNLHSTY